MLNPKTKTFWFVLISFILGGVGGAVVGTTYLGKKNQYQHRPSREQVKKEYAEKLQLTPEQLVLIDSVLEVHRGKFSEIQKRYADAFQRQRDTLRMEIRTFLTPEQNERYTEYIKEMQEREARWRRGRKP